MDGEGKASYQAYKPAAAAGGEADNKAVSQAVIERLIGNYLGRVATHVAFTACFVWSVYTILYKCELSQDIAKIVIDPTLRVLVEGLHKSFALFAFIGATTATMDLCKLIRDRDIAETRVRVFRVPAGASEISALRGTDENAFLVVAKFVVYVAIGYFGSHYLCITPDALSSLHWKTILQMGLGYFLSKSVRDRAEGKEMAAKLGIKSAKAE